MRAGQVGTIAVDGTKIKANASRHKAMSYRRMREGRSNWKGRSGRCLIAPRRWIGANGTNRNGMCQRKSRDGSAAGGDQGGARAPGSPSSRTG
jgi:hypothetical protein